MICRIFAFALIAGISSGALARGPGGPGGMPDFAQALFPPQLIMQNQSEIGLEPAQREAIIKEMQSLQGTVTPLQWEIKRIQGEIKAKIETTPIDKDATLKLLGELLETETKIKRSHFGALIAIKSLLKPQQVQQLRQLRQNMPGGPGGMPGKSRQKGGQGY